MLTVGVLSDTHIPDRARRLHPQVLPTFERAGVSAILHAGDISSPVVLEELGELAPVHAVRGNRDWVLLRHLPRHLCLNFDGVELALTHGHGYVWHYVRDRARVILGGYRLELFLPRLQATFPQAKVIVFGHTHYSHNTWEGGQLVFNPGSPHVPEESVTGPSIGLLHFESGTVRGEIVRLEPV